MNEEKMKKIEILKSRTQLCHEEADLLLDKFNGDLIEALIYFEKQKQKEKSGINDFYEKISESEFINYIKELIRDGNIARVIIRNEDTILVNIPVNAGLVAGVILILQPVLLALSAATADFTKLEIDIIKKDGSVEVVNKYVEKGIKTTTEIAKNVGNEVKDILSNTSTKIKNKINDIKKNNHR